MIKLVLINKSNWEECIHLKVKKEQQQLVASNLNSIAEVQFLPGFHAKAVYIDDRMIGFVMFGIDPDDNNYWIYRLMIDENYQGKGYGKAAMKEVMNQIEHSGDKTDKIMLGYKPDNHCAKYLYRSLGFKEVGIAQWGEMLVSYSFK